ncbi:MAG: extracellular solute-binding protein [Alphaproteobacteria bacterium]|nr:extracellular solute-binding protein [Alphaproteobacteria bacterium]
MKQMTRKLGRRRLGAASAAGLMFGGAMCARAQQKVSPITLVINQSPWFGGFKNLVEIYEKESGNKVELDVNPFAGSLEKQRNSVRSSRGQYDLLILNSGWFAEMYVGGFVEAIADIDPGFKLDPGIYTLADTCYFNPADKSMNARGKLYTMPVNPNIPLLYYRGDLYKQAGLQPPKTFDQLYDNAKKLHQPPRMLGIVQRGARGPHTVAYDFYPYLYGHGGSIFRNQDAGDHTVVLNDAKGRAALDYYLKLAKDAGHPKTAAMDQADLIQNMVTNRTAHVMMVIAAWSQMDDPTKSAVVDKVELAVPPAQPGFRSSPALGHFLAGVSKNVPDDRKRAAVEFLRWFQTAAAQIKLAEVGGVPVHKAAYEHPMSQERRYRWMKPMAEGLPNAVNIYNFPESAEVIAVLELGLNQAIAGEVASAAALNSMADRIHKIMAEKGYKTGKI